MHRQYIVNSRAMIAGPQKGHGLAHSGWLITINTNRRVDSRNDPFYKQFEQCIRELVANMWRYVQILDGASPGDARVFPEPLQITPTIERGAKQGRLHAHIAVAINHKSRIRLNFAAIRAFIKNTCGLGDFHFDVKTYKNARGELAQSAGQPAGQSLMPTFDQISARYAKKASGF